MDAVGRTSGASHLAESIARQADTDTPASLMMLKKTLTSETAQVAQLLEPVTGGLDIQA